jgi:hypothetical protein
MLKLARTAAHVPSFIAQMIIFMAGGRIFVMLWPGYPEIAGKLLPTWAAPVSGNLGFAIPSF